MRLMTRGYYSNIMRIAIEAAKAAPENEIPVGAVLAVGREIVATASNEVERSNSVWRHAEFVVIEKGLKVLRNKWLNNASLYVTLEPCCFCAELIKLARIKNVFFGAYHTFHPGLLDCNCGDLNIISGIFEQECGALVSQRFERIRRRGSLGFGNESQGI